MIRSGTDITVAGWGAVLEEVLAAADELAGVVDVEVVDLRWIAPMDVETVLASVSRTGRLLIVHEAIEFCGVGAELAAKVGERAWHDLAAPIRRLAPARHIYPPADFEADHLVDQPAIVSVIEEMCR